MELNFWTALQNYVFTYLHAQRTKNGDNHRRADGKLLLSPSLTFFSQRNMSTSL